MFLLKWYKSLRAVVRWNNQYSNVFTIGCGTRQGSILSPQLFNIFIDGLLKELSATNSGVSIGNEDFNSYAYADDVTLFCATAPGLQKLIDVCVMYASRWKFKFGIKKTKCMSVGHTRFYDYPKWLLGNDTIENVDSLDTLGVIFNEDCSSHNYVNTRVQKSYRSYYSLRMEISMSTYFKLRV